MLCSHFLFFFFTLLFCTGSCELHIEQSRTKLWLVQILQCQSNGYIVTQHMIPVIKYPFGNMEATISHVHSAAVTLGLCWAR
uniref:Secreted protein n=1 Tax=Anguilla anguilla TaxID=7936 RepID=A0A0E9X0D5_ANGAN